MKITSNTNLFRYSGCCLVTGVNITIIKGDTQNMSSTRGMGDLRAPSQQAPVVYWLPVLTAQHAPSPLQGVC